MTGSMETFDGIPVETYRARFRGWSELPEHFQMDEEVAFLVVGRVVEAKHKDNRSGGMIRENTFEVIDVSRAGGSVQGRRSQQVMQSISRELDLDDDIDELPETSTDVNEPAVVDETESQPRLKLQNTEALFTPPESGQPEHNDEALERFLQESV